MSANGNGRTAIISTAVVTAILSFAFLLHRSQAADISKVETISYAHSVSIAVLEQSYLEQGKDIDELQADVKEVLRLLRER